MLKQSRYLQSFHARRYNSCWRALYCDWVKALLWENDGFVLLYKRMEVKGRFRWPRSSQEVRQLNFLDCFSDGYLETEGYQGYNNLPGIRRCFCWAHTRRYFIDAVPKGKQYDYSNPAVQGVQFCSKLFDISFGASSK